MKYFKKTRRKRVEAWLIAAMFLFGSLTGCASVRDTHGNVGTPGDGKLKVVTTLFPYYDFARQIAGDVVDLSMVIPAGQDSHSFEPTPADIRLIQNADLLICNGGTMEQWVTQVLGSLDAPDLKVITMMDYVDVVQEEIVEGMEDSGDDHGHDHAHHDEEDGDHADHDHDTEDHADHDHDTEDHADHDHDTEDHADHDHDMEDHDHADDDHAYEIEYDEHIWTSPVNAMKITQVIADTLEEMDPADAAVFQANEADYLGKLKNLNQEFRDVVDGADLDLLVMADKFPLRYFADTYGLRYRAAFSGCSSDTEPSAKTIAYLIDKVREEQIPAVYYLELSSHRVAEIISEETGAKPLLFHSCHNVTRREFESGVTYLQLMEQNVVNLREGLYR
nr:metal ABC transporter substrate-binding protein [Clostridium sp. AM22-16AC]